MKKWIIASLTTAVLATGIVVGGLHQTSATQAPTQEQQEIKNKMLNAIDYYSSIKGSYYYQMSSGQIKQVEFNVHEGNEAGSDITIKDKQGNILSRGATDANYVLQVEEKTKTFRKSPKLKDIKLPTGPRKRIVENQPEYVYRVDPAAPIDGGNVTFPQSLAFWLDDDKQNYQIVGQENYLGRNAVVIEGDVITEKKNIGNKFRMLVDSDTGVLLHLLVSKEDDSTGMEIKVNNIEIDSPSNQKTAFNTNEPSGYKDISPTAQGK